MPLSPEVVASSHPSTTSHDRPLREACSHMIHQKDIAMRKVFEDILLHAEITFTYLREDADFDELQSHILDHAQFSRQGAIKVLQFLDVQDDQEALQEFEEGDIALLQEFRMINAIAMAGFNKLSPQVKAQEILRRSLRIERFKRTSWWSTEISERFDGWIFTMSTPTWEWVNDGRLGWNA